MANRIHLDFLVLGAQKAGTTSLHDWLMQHGDIRLPALKETHFFSHDERFFKGVDWYLEQFPEKPVVGALKGEIDPEYLFIEAAAAKIKLLTDVNKFIVVLRHPMQRAYSHYLMTVRRGFDKLPFDEAIKFEKKRLLNDADNFARDHQTYISRSLYSGQIKRYLELFPHGEFLFIKFDELVDQRIGKGVYERICDFIGTRHDVCLVDRAKSSNQASTPRLVWLRNFIYRKEKKSLLRRIVFLLLPDGAKLKIATSLDKLNQRKLRKSEIVPLQDFVFDRNIVAEVLKDLETTERLTGMSFQDWKDSLAGCRLV